MEEGLYLDSVVPPPSLMNSPYTRKETLKSLYWSACQMALITLTTFAVVIAINLEWQMIQVSMDLEPNQAINPDWSFSILWRTIVALVIGGGSWMVYHHRKRLYLEQQVEDHDD